MNLIRLVSVNHEIRLAAALLFLVGLCAGGGIWLSSPAEMPAINNIAPVPTSNPMALTLESSGWPQLDTTALSLADSAIDTNASIDETAVTSEPRGIVRRPSSPGSLQRRHVMKHKHVLKMVGFNADHSPKYGYVCECTYVPEWVWVE